MSHYYLLSLFILISFTKTIHTSIPFIMNPGCDLTQCTTPGYPAVFYANHYLGDDTIHILYSSLDELTISIIQTKKGYGPHINYTALFNRNYAGSITFGETTPINSFSLIIRRLIQFNDKDDTGRLIDNDTSTQSYWLKELNTNTTVGGNSTTQPSFQLPLENVTTLFDRRKKIVLDFVF